MILSVFSVQITVIRVAREKEGRRITQSIKNLVAKRMGPCEVNLHESCNLTALISKKLRKIASMHQFFFIS